MRSIAFLPLAASLTLVGLDARAEPPEPPEPPTTPLPAPTTPMFLHVAPPPLGAVDTLEPPPPPPPGALIFEMPADKDRDKNKDKDKDKNKKQADWTTHEPEMIPNRGRRRMLTAGGVLTGIGGFGMLLGTVFMVVDGRNGSLGDVGLGMNVLFGSLVVTGVPLLIVGGRMPSQVPAKTSLMLVPGPGFAAIQGSF